MDTLCRLCGSKDGIRIRIFDPETDYVKRIHKVLPITINEQDPFPKSMCHKCSFKVNEFFEFRNKCIEAQEIFRNKISWLNNKDDDVNTSNPPMVEIHMSPLDSISPNEKSFPKKRELVDEKNSMIVIDDSPPYQEETSFGRIEVMTNPQNNRSLNSSKNIARKKTRPRDVWNSKKRKKKKRNSPELNCKIAEVFTTSLEEYQTIDREENDPLDTTYKTSDMYKNNNCSGQTSSSLSPHERNTNNVLIKTESSPSSNYVTLPKNIITTRIPQVGLVYTCESCGRTFLSPTPATTHVCDFQVSSDDDTKRNQEKETAGSTPNNTATTSDYYHCDFCTKVFTRQSQLNFHIKRHRENVTDSSSFEKASPSNKRKRYSKTRRRIKKKSELLKKKENNFIQELCNNEENITRHSLLSSESD